MFVQHLGEMDDLHPERIANETHYPPAPSIVEQALTAYRRYRQLLRDMTPGEFVEYHKAAVREKAIHTPYFCKVHCSHG